MFYCCRKSPVNLRPICQTSDPFTFPSFQSACERDINVLLSWNKSTRVLSPPRHKLQSRHVRQYRGRSALARKTPVSSFVKSNRRIASFFSLTVQHNNGPYTITTFTKKNTKKRKILYDLKKIKIKKNISDFRYFQSAIFSCLFKRRELGKWRAAAN